MSDEEPYIIVGEQTARKLVAPKRRKYLIPLAGIGVLAVAIVATVIALSSGTSSAMLPVKRGNIVHSLAAQGRVESDTTIVVIPKRAARIQTIHVQEGDKVKVGQLLVTLRDKALEAEYREAVETREESQAAWDEIKRGARKEDLDQARARVRQALHEWNRLKAKLAEVLRGARPEVKKDAEAKLEKAQAKVTFWRTEWNRVKDLSSEDVLTKRERDQTKQNLQTAEAHLKEMQANLDRIVNGATEEEKDQARAGVQIAKSKHDEAKSSLERLETGATPEKRRRVEAKLKRAKATVTRLKAQLAELVMKSPLDAVVLRRYYEPGELATPQMRDPILVLGDSRKKTVRIEVIENDIYKLKKGQIATIVSDAYPGRTWKGEVTRIAPVLGKKKLSTQNPKEKWDVKVLEVWITPKEAMDLPLNLPIEASIHEVIREGVLIIPAVAVNKSGEVILEDGDRKKITTGYRDDAYIEVISGLAEGDLIRMPK